MAKFLGQASKFDTLKSIDIDLPGPKGFLPETTDKDDELPRDPDNRRSPYDRTRDGDPRTNGDAKPRRDSATDGTNDFGVPIPQPVDRGKINFTTGKVDDDPDNVPKLNITNKEKAKPVKQDSKSNTLIAGLSTQNMVSGGVLLLAGVGIWWQSQN